MGLGLGLVSLVRKYRRLRRVKFRVRRPLTLTCRLLVKCGIAACRIRKVKCGMEGAESYCGTVGNMRNAESCSVSGRMHFQPFTRGVRMRVG